MERFAEYQYQILNSEVSRTRLRFIEVHLQLDELCQKMEVVNRTALKRADHDNGGGNDRTRTKQNSRGSKHVDLGLILFQ